MVFFVLACQDNPDSPDIPSYTGTGYQEKDVSTWLQMRLTSLNAGMRIKRSWMNVRDYESFFFDGYRQSPVNGVSEHTTDRIVILRVNPALLFSVTS